MQIIETSIHNASGFSTDFFHTLIKQRQKSNILAIRRPPITHLIKIKYSSGVGFLTAPKFRLSLSFRVSDDLHFDRANYCSQYKGFVTAANPFSHIRLASCMLDIAILNHLHNSCRGNPPVVAPRCWGRHGGTTPTNPHE